MRNKLVLDEVILLKVRYLYCVRLLCKRMSAPLMSKTLHLQYSLNQNETFCSPIAPPNNWINALLTLMSSPQQTVA